MNMNSTNPTSSVCRPLYYEDYFIFDRESLLSLSSSASADPTSVLNQEGNSVKLSTSEARTVTVSSYQSSLYTEIQLRLLQNTFCIETVQSVFIACVISPGYTILGLYCGVSEPSSAQSDLLLSLLPMLCYPTQLYAEEEREDAIFGGVWMWHSHRSRDTFKFVSLPTKHKLPVCSCIANT